jgi:flavin-dependent dehydrogenase
VTECDIAIIGGGPTGTAAALTLLRHSKLRPLIIERSSYEGWRVGETLSPGVAPLLAYLGAEEVLSHGQRRAYATSAAWGSDDVVSRDFLFTGGGDAWHLDRSRFDASLARLVTERGGMLLTGTVVTRAEPQWTLTTSGGEINAKFVIDATGRHAAFARMQGARVTSDDHLMGLVSMFDTRASDAYTATLVEAVEDGWWYSARLPEHRIVVAFMTDADIVREHHLHEQKIWLARLRETGPTWQRVERARLAHGPITCPAHSQIVDPVSGDGWLAAGEAAVGFDPLSSMGIGYAIASGIQAARVAASSLGGDREHARLFAQDVRRHYDAYLAQRQAYYAMEQRWPDSPFWQRRQ